MSYSLHRRGFLKGALAAGALIPLAACAGNTEPEKTPANTPADTPAGTTDPTENATTTTQADPKNPFGLESPSAVDAAIFNGGYGVAYTEFAGKMVEKAHAGVKVTVTKVQDETKELQPRFAGGDPPDVVDNSGAGKIGISAILSQIEDLSDVIDSPNYEGEVIRDTLFTGVLDPGTIDGKFAVINYVLTVFGLWYSASLFEENGWEPPKTWDDAIALGAKAKEKGKYLFLWGNEAADYFMEMSITSAIKEGGDEVRIALDNLEEGCWSKPAIQDVFRKLEEIVKAGYIKPGGGGTQFTAAQAGWSQAQDALLYPSGAWIENEMKNQTKEDFKMTGAPVPTVTTSPKMPYEGIHSAADEAFFVPSKGKNVAGGKEFMRAMLSKEAATNFAKVILSPTIVKDTVPDDGFGSTALVSQIKMLGDAGENVFTWKFNGFYGMGPDHVVLWNSFLDGQFTTAELTSKLQEITDAVAKDSAIDKFTVS